MTTATIDMAIIAPTIPPTNEPLDESEESMLDGIMP